MLALQLARPSQKLRWLRQSRATVVGGPFVWTSTVQYLSNSSKRCPRCSKWTNLLPVHECLSFAMVIHSTYSYYYGSCSVHWHESGHSMLLADAYWEFILDALDRTRSSNQLNVVWPRAYGHHPVSFLYFAAFFRGLRRRGSSIYWDFYFWPRLFRATQPIRPDSSPTCTVQLYASSHWRTAQSGPPTTAMC